MKFTSALVMTLGDPSSDPRPRRMIELLKSRGLTVAVISNPCRKDLNVNQHFIIPFKTSLLEKIKKRLVRCSIFVARMLPFAQINIKNLDEIILGFRPNIHLAELKSYDLIIVEDLNLLSFALKIKERAKIIFDAREYYPSQNEEKLLWRIMERPERVRLCRTYLPEVDLSLTVSPGLAEEYETEFGVDSLVYRSVPNYRHAKPKRTKGNEIRLVHHGAANKNRKLEKMIEVIALLGERFKLDMYLMGDLSYIDFLKNYARNVPRVRILEPVDYEDIHATLCKYDIGFFYNEPATYNLRHSLPNKLFEFIQARLPVAIGPSPDMASLVNKYRCGVVSKQFSVHSMAAELNALTTAEIDGLKSNSDIAASELNFEKESRVFLDALLQLG